MHATKPDDLVANIQEKLRNILHAARYCGVCLKNTTNLCSVMMDYDIVLNGTIYRVILKDVLAEVFQNVNNVPISSYICKLCADQAMEAYIFINNTKDSMKLIEEYVNDFYSETDKLLVKLDKLPKNEKTKIIMILENNRNRAELNLSNTEMNSEYNVTETEIDDFLKVTDSETNAKEPINRSNNEITNGNIDMDYCSQNNDDDDISKLQDECSQCHINPCTHYKYLISFQEQKRLHEDVKCLDCDFTCTSKEVLVIHANRVHLDFHPFTCDDCGTQFYSKQSMKRHITYLHRDKLNCDFCDRQFINRSLYNTHVSSCKDIKREFMCTQCAASFETSDELHNHTKLKHSTENFPCNLCKMKCLTEENLREHQRRSHSKVEKLRKPRQWVCGHCEKVFESQKECSLHRKSHNPNDKYLCRICNKDFTHIKHLQWHNRIHKEKKSSYPEQCKVCGKTVKVLRAHMRLHRLEDHPLIFICEQCGEVFSSKTKLDYHYLKHKESIPCSICKQFVKASRMASHIKKHNQTGEEVRKNKKLECKYCGHLAPNQERLEGHVNRYHLKIKPFKCNDCGASFCAKHHLNQHMKMHEEDLNYSCETCNKKFRYKFSLQKHMYIHTGEKPYICDICEEGFTGSSYLKEHKLKHAEKSVSCPLCGTMFFALKNMRLHFKKQHWKDQKGEYDPKALLSEEYHYLFEDHRKIKLDLTENL